MTEEKAIELVKRRCEHFYYMNPANPGEPFPLRLDSEVVLHDTNNEPVWRTTISKLIPEEIDREMAQKFEPSIWHMSNLIDYSDWHKEHPFAVLPPLGEPPQTGIALPMFKNDLISRALKKQKTL